MHEADDAGAAAEVRTAGAVSGVDDGVEAICASTAEGSGGTRLHAVRTTTKKAPEHARKDTATRNSAQACARLDKRTK